MKRAVILKAGWDSSGNWNDPKMKPSNQVKLVQISIQLLICCSFIQENLLFELIDIKKVFLCIFSDLIVANKQAKKSREKFFNPFIKLSDILMHYDKVDLARTHLSQKNSKPTTKNIFFSLSLQLMNIHFGNWRLHDGLINFYHVSKRQKCLRKGKEWKYFSFFSPKKKNFLFSGIIRPLIPLLQFRRLYSKDEWNVIFLG